jgi:hypothetical protein
MSRRFSFHVCTPFKTITTPNNPKQPQKGGPLSHIVSIQTEVRDEAAVQSACQRLHLPPATRGTFQLYSSTETGLGVELPHWRYPVVANTETGQLRFDNFQGHWGPQEFLDQFLQMYAVERAKIEARRHGHTVTEQSLANGSIKLTINVGGAA